MRGSHSFMERERRKITKGGAQTGKDEPMKEYEVIWEIFNKCPRNQMRDVMVEEVELEDPEEYVKKKLEGKDVSCEKTVLADGTIIFDIVTSQIKQRCSFTEI